MPRQPDDPIRDDDSGVTYHPYIGEQGEVGYRVAFADGRPDRWFYLNPSGGSDDGVPTIFVYEDEEPGVFANALHHYLVGE